MVQNWDKIGLVYNSAKLPGYSYAAVPVAFFVDKSTLRVFHSKRNNQNQSLPFYFDLDVEKGEVVKSCAKPILDMGETGTFDDSGVMPTCIVENNSDLWMYYIGWNLGVSVPFRNSIGLAISKDQGKSFKKLFKGPILDRTKNEPHFCASCHVIKDQKKWKIWYLSCIKWEKNQNSNKKHHYHIKYAESKNGIDWDRKGVVAIDFKYQNEYAISVPRVIKEGDVYKMWYTYRGGLKSNNYRIGYAESKDGTKWSRKDELVFLELTGNSFDSEMLCYPFLFDYNGYRYMLYNGNGYGKSGIGWAKLLKKDGHGN